MPKIDLTDNEVTLLLEGVDMLVKSARRAQNTGRSPQIKQVWQEHERQYIAMDTKLRAAK